MSYELHIGRWHLELLEEDVYRLKADVGLQVELDEQCMRDLFRLLQAAAVLENGRKALDD